MAEPFENKRPEPRANVADADVFIGSVNRAHGITSQSLMENDIAAHWLGRRRRLSPQIARSPASRLSMRRLLK